MNAVLGEQWLSETVDLLVRVVEVAGAFIIFLGAMVALARFVVVGIRDRRSGAFVPVRLSLSGAFSHSVWSSNSPPTLSRTAIAPTLREIAELAAVAAIRTALNFFSLGAARRRRARRSTHA